MKLILTLALGTISLALNAAPKDAPKNLNFLRLEASGPGCEPGTVSRILSEDREAFTLSFATFIAATEMPDSNKQRTRCSLSMSVNKPQKWAFGIVALEIRGFASTGANSSAVTTVKRVVEGSRNVLLAKETIEAHHDDFFQYSYDVPLTDVTWYGCKRTDSLRLNVVARAEANGSEDSYIAIDSVDGSGYQEFGVVWRKCRGETKQKHFGVCKVRLEKINNPDRRLRKKIKVNAQAKDLVKLKEKLSKKIKRKCNRPKLGERGFRCKPFQQIEDICRFGKIKPR
ncbi:MAG: DUF4360 domain-containing protein [Pseudobacteriovorax sp.]|nr:DUF4360 domain-containing protein [Pseudobacteriovorax sp.]